MYFQKLLNFKTHIILTILLTMFMGFFSMIEKKIGVPCENNMVDQVGTYTPLLLISLALF